MASKNAGGAKNVTLLGYTGMTRLIFSKGTCSGGLSASSQLNPFGDPRLDVKISQALGSFSDRRRSPDFLQVCDLLLAPISDLQRA